MHLSGPICTRVYSLGLMHAGVFVGCGFVCMSVVNGGFACGRAERPGTVGFLAATLCCVVAVSYSPTTCRLQYHWRCRA